jgi:2-polyprenyl-3-methyl-5-hydroxy-6-metoxy-1,4-benzoquinol methylase
MMNKKKFYDEIDNTAMPEDGKRRVDLMLNLLKGKTIATALDIGCVPEMAEYYSNILGCKTLGINVSEKVVNSQKNGGNVQLVQGDAETADFGGAYDLIFCGEVLEHLENPDAFIEKVKNHLKNDGYLVLTIPNLASLFNRMSLLLDWQPRGINPSRKMLLNPLLKYDYNWGHVSMFTHYSLQKFLKANGFKVLAVKGVRSGHKGENRLLSFVRALTSIKASFAEQIVVVAKM